MRYRGLKNKNKYIYFFLLILLVLFLLSFRIGRYPIPFRLLVRVIGSKFFNITRDWDPTIETVIFQIRLPRILAGILVGGALSISGAVYQAIFKNPLVSPDILGVSSGAAFGASLAILLSFSRTSIQLSAFFFGLLSVLLVYLISRKIKDDPIISLVIIGVLIGSIFTSLTSLSKYMADSDNKLPTISFWLMGSLADISIKDLKIVVFPFLLGVLPLFSLAWKLNVMSLNEDEAKTLGIDTGRIRIVVVLASTLITASAVSISGIVGWIGLLIPHLARLIVGPNHEKLLPVSLVMGSSYLLLVDNLARALTSIEIPLGILSSLVGVPIFLFIIIHKNKVY